MAARRARPLAAFCAALLLAAVPAAGGPAPAPGPEVPGTPDAVPPPPLPADVGPVTGRKLPRYVSLRAEANVRRGPGADHRVDWVLKHPRMPLRIVAEYGHWRKVVDSEGSGGWVLHALLRGDRTAIVRAPGTRLRKAPDAGARVVAIAEPGVIAELDACLADWCEVSAGGHDGWVPKADIWGVDPGEVFD